VTAVLAVVGGLLALLAMCIFGVLPEWKIRREEGSR